MNPYLVIMAGGIGSRFWPMSRLAKPKQFLDILNQGHSLLQATYHRLVPSVFAPERVLVVTNSDYVSLVHQQLPELPLANILAEPVGRNTAPCIAYATHKLLKRDPEAVLVVSPADHHIQQADRFCHDIRSAIDLAVRQPSIVTLGIRPTRPDTGYGYIQFLSPEGPSTHHPVKTFTEKPMLEMARAFVESGEFLWNSGIFIFSGRVMHQALQQHLPEVNNLFAQVGNELDGPGEAAAMANVYATVRSISIDYGVMERTEGVLVIPSDCGWSDLGTWNSLHEHLPHDAHQNAVSGDAMLYDSELNLVQVPEGKLVVLKGIQNLIVVDTPDVLLVCPRDREQEVRDVVHDLRQRRDGRHM